MTTGIGLLYVGCVLLLNGIGMLKGFDKKAVAVMNFFTGGLYAVINAVNLAYAVFAQQELDAYFQVATGMLFGFTYLFVGLTNLFGLDARPQAWYCFFVAVNTVPCALLAFDGGDVRFGVIWLCWGFLWMLYWIAGALGKVRLPAKLVPYARVAVGVATCWAPGYMMLAGWW